MNLSPGTRLNDRYELLSPLGAGGMGEVYRGRDIRLERDVAIKILPERIAASPNSLKRFRREAKALASLHHPNILVIHDFDSHEGIHYAVTEFLHGQTLRSKLNQSNLPWEKCVQIAVEVCEGLSAAHSQGIIHRDIKPENIFLTADSKVKILDFGLVHLQEGGEGTSDFRTTISQSEPGTLLGTLPYMSPEQVRGLHVDQRSDIFAVGCVLFESITGNRPFRGTTPVEILYSIVNYDPSLDWSLPIPDDLRKVITRCVEKNPDARFQSASDLVFSLKTILSHPRRPTDREPARILQAIAILPFVNDSKQSELEYLSDGITESIINSISQLPALRVMARSTVFRYKSSPLFPQQIGKELKVHAVLTGRVVQFSETLDIHVELVNVEDGSQIWGERFLRQAGDLLSVQEEIAQEIFEKLRLKLSGDERKRLSKRHTEDPEAYQLYLKGRFQLNKRTIESIHKAIEFFREAIDVDPQYALAHAGMADSYNFLERYSASPANEVMPKARSAAMQALALDESLAEAHAALGLTRLYFDWDWPGAETEFRRAIELNPRYPPAHQWLGWYLAAMGHFEEAYESMETARLLDPLSLIINTNVGTMYYFWRRYDLAAEQLRKTLEIEPKFIVAHQWLGRVYEQQGSWEEAAAEHRFGVNAAQEDTESVASLAHSYALAGRTGEARWILHALLARRKEYYIPAYWIALIYCGLREKDDALNWLMKAYEERFDWLIFLNVEPLFDPLRPETRFTELLRLLGLDG